jgi:hypothetical protein
MLCTALVIAGLLAIAGVSAPQAQPAAVPCAVVCFPPAQLNAKKCSCEVAISRKPIVAQDSNTCTIATRDALDTFVRASVGKTIPYAMVAVISGVEAP